MRFYIPAWKSREPACGNRATRTSSATLAEKKIRGLVQPPESRKYLVWKGLNEVNYFLPFFAFLVLFLAAFFFAGMWTVTSSWQI